jgi:hypothetical protein
MRVPFLVSSASSLLAVLAFSASARAAAEAPSDSAPKTAFDQPLALATYTQGWAGAYDGVGVGGRARWEFWQHHAGLDLFGEFMMVDWPGGGERHDIPIGFDVYAPFALGRRVRLRAMAGMCAVFSFIEPAMAGAPSSDDVLFGVHAGAGIEVAMIGPFAWFLDAQAVWYLGHDRTADAWSGSVSGNLSQAVVFQPTTGVELAFGR